MAPPDLPLVGLETGLVIAALVIAGYLVAGLLHDIHRRQLRAIRGRMQDDLARVLFRPDEEAAEAAARLAQAPRSAVFDLVQRLAVDLLGDADVRLRRLVSSAGLTRAVRSRIRSRSWRRRAQGAALASLLPEGDPDRLVLLDDRHPTVRARATESLERHDICHNAELVTVMLDDPSEAVRFAAQQALLRGDSRIVPALVVYLNTTDGEGTAWALEVAANFPDPRLISAIERQAASTDPRRRAIAARALGPWLSDASTLAALLTDDVAEVRATAAETIGSVGAQEQAANVGRLLRDEAWVVRRSAAIALSSMGAAGAMTLRVYTRDDDAYARDMASQMLAIMEARHSSLRPAYARSGVAENPDASTADSLEAA